MSGGGGGGGGGKAGRRLPEEEHVNHERWLVTYADMITLLMVLFIVLFAMSTVDQRKFNALKQGLSAGFGAAPSITDGSQGVMAESGADGVLAAMAPTQVQPQTPADKAAAEAVDAAVTQHDQKQLQAQYAEALAEAKRLKAVSDKVLQLLREKNLENDIRVGVDDRGLVLSLVSRHVVFEPNMADLTTRGKEVLDILAPVLRDIESKLEIDGHTNQEAVKPKYYPTDWELSSARSITVLRHLNEVGDVPNDRMTSAAFGHEKPLVDPAKPDSQRVNKRVDIVVLSPLSAEGRALLKIVFEKLPDTARPDTQETEDTEDTQKTQTEEGTS